MLDTHLHSIYSFDGHDSPAALAQAAIARGVSGFVITDHYDIDGVLDGLYPDYDGEAARAAIDEARTAFAGQVEIYRGIELGQPGLRPEESRAFLNRYGFDFVICSCHNLRGVPDFYFMDCTEMSLPLMESLYRRMLEELTLHAAVPGTHTVAHLSYPLRYMAKSPYTVSIEKFEAELRTLYHVMRENGLAYEVNTKGLRKNLLPIETEIYLLSLWRDAGGRDVTIGSDAHWAHEMGLGLDLGYDLLRRTGFTSVRFPTPSGMGSANIDAIEKERGTL